MSAVLPGGVTPEAATGPAWRVAAARLRSYLEVCRAQEFGRRGTGTGNRIGVCGSAAGLARGRSGSRRSAGRPPSPHRAPLARWRARQQRTLGPARPALEHPAACVPVADRLASGDLTAAATGAGPGAATRGAHSRRQRRLTAAAHSAGALAARHIHSPDPDHGRVGRDKFRGDPGRGWPELLWT